MASQLTNVIDGFESVSLKQMNAVKLLNRTDTKYAFHVDSLCEVLSKISSDYCILKIDNGRVFHYETLYYDTQNSDMFISHHNGKLNRYKIRKRNYVESKACYLEIKFKNNKGRTIKKRIETDDLSSGLSKGEQNFISDNSLYQPDQLKPKLSTSFKRFTLTNHEKTERITVDLDLSFKDDTHNEELHNVCIMEIKQDKLNKDSRLVGILREMKIQPDSMSKYCIATALLNNKIKRNNFKPKLLKLKKIENA